MATETHLFAAGSGGIVQGVKFSTTVELGGKNATGLPVPESVVQSLSDKKRFPVSVTVAGHTYASTLVFYKGQFVVPLSAEHRSAAGVEAGQTVEVDIVVDDAVRTVAVPDDLATALVDNEIRPAFDALSYSNQRAHVLSVDGAKTDATRIRRIDKVVETLRNGS